MVPEHPFEPVLILAGAARASLDACAGRAENDTVLVGTVLDRQQPGGKFVAEHSNVDRIKGGYAAFGTGDFAALNDLLAEDVLWHFGGRSQLAGDYRGREAVYGMFGKLMEVTEGSLHLDIRAVFADDEHGVVLVVFSASRGGRSVKIDEAHIYRMRDGQVAEFWDAYHDQYALDELIG
jgi:uncharacterized protein